MKTEDEQFFAMGDFGIYGVEDACSSKWELVGHTIHENMTNAAVYVKDIMFLLQDRRFLQVWDDRHSM